MDVPVAESPPRGGVSQGEPRSWEPFTVQPEGRRRAASCCDIKAADVSEYGAPGRFRLAAGR